MAFSRTNMVSQGQISASHSLQIIKALEGDSGQGQPIALTALNSGSAFALDVKNAGAGGALRVQNTSGTALLTVNDSGVQVATGTITTAITALPVSATWNAAGVTFLGLDVAITRTAAAAASRLFRVRQDGNVIFSVAAVASAATGLLVTPAAAASGLDLSVVTTGTNENLTVNAAGSGTITFGNTSTGNIVSTRNHSFSSTITMSTAASQLIPGATSFSLRNNANNADNLIILDAGGATFRGALAITGALSGVTTLAASGIVTASAASGHVFGGGSAASGYRLSAAGGTSDDTRYYTMASAGGGNTGYAGFASYTTTGVTTAKQIAAMDNRAAWFFVSGNDGTNFFADLVVCGYDAGTPTVINSYTETGTPAARTYSATTGVLKVALASGTYSVSTLVIDLKQR